MSDLARCFEEVEIPEEDLGEEEVEERDTFTSSHLDAVDSPLLNFFLSALGGQGSAAQSRGQRFEQGGSARDDPVVVDGKLYGQDFHELRASHLERGELFTDAEFPPDGRSIFFSKSAHGLEWRRPHELVDDPRLFVGGGDRFDINQGELGDCWLLAAMANMAMNKRVRAKVVPLDQSFSEEYAGIFHFRFWQYGDWVDVVVDDYLPTRNGELVFMHSDSKNEFWTALFEKAYAKLNGSYESLKGGTTLEGMVDFTGGCSEMYELKKPPRDLFTILLKAFDRCSLMGCSLEPDPHVLEAKTSKGLVRGHAYSVTKVVKARIQTPKVSGEMPLVRVRNPWGNETEWNGAWSDGSGEWNYVPDEEKENIGLNFEADGEFWMSFKDFIKHFDQLEICNLNPDALDVDNPFRWEVTTYQGQWINGSSAGGCRNNIATFASNPQFLVSLEDPDEGDADNKCTIIINLMQRGRRALRDEGLDLLTIGFCVYHLKEQPNGRLDTAFFKYNASCARSKAFINLREICARFKLPPGHYVIVPSTFNPGEEGDFLLRIFAEKPHNSSAV